MKAAPKPKLVAKATPAKVTHASCGTQATASPRPPPAKRPKLMPKPRITDGIPKPKAKPNLATPRPSPAVAKVAPQPQTHQLIGPIATALALEPPRKPSPLPTTFTAILPKPPPVTLAKPDASPLKLPNLPVPQSGSKKLSSVIEKLTLETANKKTAVSPLPMPMANHKNVPESGLPFPFSGFSFSGSLSKPQIPLSPELPFNIPPSIVVTKTDSKKVSVKSPSLPPAPPTCTRIFTPIASKPSPPAPNDILAVASNKNGMPIKNSTNPECSNNGLANKEVDNRGVQPMLSPSLKTQFAGPSNVTKEQRKLMDFIMTANKIKEAAGLDLNK